MAGIRLGTIGIGVTATTHTLHAILTVGIGDAIGIGVGVITTTITTTHTAIITIVLAHTWDTEVSATRDTTADTMAQQVETLAPQHLRCVRVRTRAHLSPHRVV